MVQPESSVDLYVLVFGGALALSLLVAGVIGFVLLYQRRVSEQELVVKQMELNYQQEVVYRTLDAVEDERKRVARDLHDEVGAALSAMRLLVGQLAHILPPTTETTQLISRHKGVIDNTMESVRRIANDLLPQGLDELGLTYALEGLCENAMAVSEVTIELAVDAAIVLPARANLILYRLVQELLNNAVKHANATDIQLSLRQHADLITMQYIDNGNGFDYEQAYQKRSLGLKNIETRAHMLRGTVQFDTQPSRGLQVTVVFQQTVDDGPY